METQQPITISVFRWAGQWGPFKIKIPCGECAITNDIILDVMANELSDIPILLDSHEWLSEWWKPLRYGAWHAPIVTVGNKIVSEGNAVNRGAICQAVIEQYVQRFEVQGSFVYGKERCPHCHRAKKMLEKKNIPYQYMDVVKNARALYEMFPRAKQYLGNKTPITVPQIWLNGKYIGGADQLELFLEKQSD